MNSVNLEGISDSAKIYLRPVHYIESPQQHDGQAARLAGTMLWFCSVEIIAKQDGANIRVLIPVADFEDTVASLPEGQAARAKELFANITAIRAPLQLRDRTIRLETPQVMGILNVTPDSFSDGGKNVEIEGAVNAAHAMSADGAALIDIGGESTRPGAELVWEGEETNRTQPVIEKLALSGAAISIDSRKSAVMTAALNAGAGMINDISALLYDDQSMDVAVQSGASVCLMHAPSQSSDPHKNDGYADVVTEVFDFLEERIAACVAAGIPKEKIMVDPGLGFGKSLADNLAIINNLAIYHGLGCPLLFGASRKRMIGALSKEEAADARLGGSIHLAMRAVEQGAHIIRVHDVPETVQAIAVWQGLRDGAFTALA